MKILFENYWDDLNRDNRVFEQKNAAIGDDLLLPFQVLKEAAAKRGIVTGTRSAVSLEEADAVVFIDLPDTSRPQVRQLITSGKPLYLIVLESPLVRPVLVNDNLVGKFLKVFTYDDSMVDGRRFIKTNFSFDLSQKIRSKLSDKSKLAVMIAGNKRNGHPKELYSDRIATIAWFEKNHPEDFDLYGVGWLEHHFGDQRPLCALNRCHPLRRLLARNYASYRGPVERKREVLERYRFAICYENIKNVAGYITEKIFDCFFAGCVPVYWGADNVSDYIPADCFIDRRKFDSHEALYAFMAGISDSDYREYLRNISGFLSGAPACQFSVDTFAATILNEIVSE